MNEIYKNYLEHHGILGQKWGRKNGPPYPLSAGAHSAAEKKAGWRKSLDKGGDKDKSSKSSGKKAASVNDDTDDDVFADLNKLKTETPPSFKLPMSNPSVQSYIKRQELSSKVNEKLSSNDEWYRLAKKIHKENPDIDGNNIDELKKHYTKDDVDRILEKSGYPSSDSSRQYVEDFIGKKYASYLEDEDTNGGQYYMNKYKRNQELKHHGILGQKHGVRNGPPYPLSAGAHSAAEKKAGWRQSLGSYMKAKKEKKRQAAVEAHDAAKKDALESGDADRILKYRKEFTNQELNDALNRAKTVNSLRNETDSNRLRDIKKAMDTVKTIKDAVNLGIDSVETARKLKKTFTPEKKEKPNDFEKSLQSSLEQFGKMSVDELMKTDTMKKLKDTREAGEEYNKLKKAVNKVTDDDDKKKDKK